MAIVNPTVSVASNRLNGTTYDVAGNVITDAEGREFTYDAENKQVEVDSGSSQLIGQYYFDGDGKRVKKVVPNGETTIFVYDASGRLIGEYSTVVQPTQETKTQYLTSDHLGTPRINTNGVGAVVSRSDYMPYGEEIIGLGERSSNEKYVVDNLRHGFTGYLHDSESDLDFSPARVLSARTGRYLSADPLYMEDKRTADPQLLNIYIYTRNLPTRLTDPLGLDIELKGKEKEWAFEQISSGLSFKLELMKNGKIAVVDANGKVLDNKKDKKAIEMIGASLNGPEKELFDAITNTSITATLRAETNDDSVDFGSVVKKGENAVDRAEVEMLANADGAGGVTTSDVVKHEVMEAFQMAGGKSFDDAHNNNPYSPLFAFVRGANSDARGNITDLTFGGIGGPDPGAGSFTFVKKLNPAVPLKSLATKVPKGSIVNVTFTPTPPKKTP